MIAFTHSLEYFRVDVVRWINYSALEIVEVSMKNLLKQPSRSCATPRINISLLVLFITAIITLNKVKYQYSLLLARPLNVA